MVTVLIFSYNRHSYLRRALTYWATSDCSVIIADGSDSSLLYDFPLNVKYFHRPNVSVLNRILEMVSIATTPFVVLGTDDDFIALNGLSVVVEFLNKNADYSSAQGYYTRFDQRHLNSTPRWFLDYRYASNYSFLDAAMESRLQSAMRPPIMHYCYSVMQSSAMKKTLDLLRGVEEMSISTFELSFIPGLMSQGKHAALPVFFGARQTQQQSWTESMKLDVWIERNSVDGYSKWRANICELFQEENGCSEREAARIVDDAIAMCLSGYHAKRLRGEQRQGKRMSLIREIIGGLPNACRENFRSLRMFVFSIADLYRMFGFDLKMLSLFRRDWLKIRLAILAHPIAEIHSADDRS